MSQKTIPFSGTPEQEKALKAVIDSHKDMKGAVIPVLHEAQNIYGYLPIEVQQMIAEGLNVPLAEIYGIVTFYAQFSLNPKGKYQIGVCLGTACYVKGAGQVIDKFSEVLKIKPGETTEDGLFTIDALRCIGACGIAPAVSINGKVYPKVQIKDIPGIVGDLVAEAAAEGGNA